MAAGSEVELVLYVRYSTTLQYKHELIRYFTDPPNKMYRAERFTTAFVMALGPYLRGLGCMQSRCSPILVFYPRPKPCDSSHIGQVFAHVLCGYQALLAATRMTPARLRIA